MADPKHATEQVRKCDIQGCKRDAERSVSWKKVEAADMNLSGDSTKSAHLCKEHYREFKKKTKKDRTYERLGW